MNETTNQSEVPRPVEILLVEDSPADVALTREALQDSKLRNNLHVVTDGEAAMAFLRRTGPYASEPLPDLILLDLNLPKKNGREVLAEIKDGKGNPSPLKPKWVSVDPKVATVDGEGVVTSGAEGRTNIIASLGNDVSSACDVKVLHRAIATFELTPLTLIMKAGETQRITATIRDSTGVLIEDAALAWTSSDPRTATVSNGTVTGVGRGTARISVATSTQTLTADVLVN